MSYSIEEQVAKMGTGPLTEAAVQEHLAPLFARNLERDRRTSEIYLANHSLGRPLDQTAFDVQEGLDAWYDRMDDAWSDDAWPSEIARFRADLAKLIGLDRFDLVVPKTSAGQGLRAVLNALPRTGPLRPLRIVATRGEFDSVDVILKTYEERSRAIVAWIEPTERDWGDEFDSRAIQEQIVEGTDLVVLSHVVFATGQILPDLKDSIARAHRVGALVVVDAYHSVGVFPVDMMELDADFMIGGSYKYLRGGPGACWLAIHPRHADGGLQTLDTGWFAKKSPFKYERPSPVERAAGGDSWLESTPSAMTFYQSRAGIQFVTAVGVDRLRRYSLQQRESLRTAFEDCGVHCHVPEDPNRFGGFTLLPHQDAFGFVDRLREVGVVTDARTKSVRFGYDVMNTERELRIAAQRTRECLDRTKALS